MCRDGADAIPLLHEATFSNSAADAAEALIEEARQRQQKRWLVVAIVVLVAVVVAVSAMKPSADRALKLASAVGDHVA
jgi:hypothetical protein